MREIAAAMRGREKVWWRIIMGFFVAIGWVDEGEKGEELEFVLVFEGEVGFECGGGGGGGGGRGSTKAGVRGIPSEEK